MADHGSKRGVLVYLPEELHRWLKAKAALEGTTLSAVIETAARNAYPDAPSNSGALTAREPIARYGKPRARRRGA